MVACKAPSNVDLANITASLSGVLINLTPQQLQQLPALVQATITVNPATLAVSAGVHVQRATLDAVSIAPCYMSHAGNWVHPYDPCLCCFCTPLHLPYHEFATAAAETATAVAAAASLLCSLPQPFFSLTGAQLNTLLPLLTQVSVDKLTFLLPLLARQPPGTVEKLLGFIQLVSAASGLLAPYEPLGGSCQEPNGVSLFEWSM